MLPASIILKHISAAQQGKMLLDDISLSIRPGQHLAIVGESGCGKSSLARAIAGRLFTTGEIDIIYTENPPLAPIVVLLDSTAGFKNLSNLAEFYYQQRYNSCDAENALTVEQELRAANAPVAAIEEWLTQLNLAHRKHTPVIQLSNGEQKKLQLIKVLALQPQVLILDNVYVGLDASSRNELSRILDRQAALGTTIVMATDERNLPGCITHIAELRNGRLAQFEERKSFVAFQSLVTRNKKKELPAILQNNTVEKFDRLVQMKNVSVRYGEKYILRSINWEVKQGEHWLVKGHNGAGKSTLLSLVTADNPQAYSQNIWLFGRRRGTGETIWDIKKQIGFVSPELHRYFDRGTSVYQAVASGFFDTIGLFRQPDNSQEKLINAWIEWFGLQEYAMKPLFLLPDGLQRKALLARALVKYPALLVLDEPCQGLDETQTLEFVQLIDAICNASETTLIYITHYDSELPGCISKTLELHEGKQVEKEKKKIVTDSQSKKERA